MADQEKIAKEWGILVIYETCKLKQRKINKDCVRILSLALDCVWYLIYTASGPGLNLIVNFDRL